MASVEETLCAICQAPFLVGEENIGMECDHVFHELCIMTYKGTFNTSIQQLQCPICSTQDDLGFVKEEDSSSESESALRKRWFGDYEHKLYKNIHTVDEAKAKEMGLKPKSRPKAKSSFKRDRLGHRIPILYRHCVRASGSFSWMQSSDATDFVPIECSQQP